MTKFGQNHGISVVCLLDVATVCTDRGEKYTPNFTSIVVRVWIRCPRIISAIYLQAAVVLKIKIYVTNMRWFLH